VWCLARTVSLAAVVEQPTVEGIAVVVDLSLSDVAEFEELEFCAVPAIPRRMSAEPDI
jgi:hypothetical protein